MTVISFFVPEEPFAKRRPRFGKGRVYTDPQTVAAEQALRWYAKKAFGDRPPITGPVKLELKFMLAIPVKNRDKARVAGAPHTQKSDIDNLIKLMDGLNPNETAGWPGLWRDDSQIYLLTAVKVWSNPGREGTHVTVYFDEGEQTF